MCLFVCAGPLVPHQSWLGCAVWVGVLELWFLLRSATPGWGVGVCVFVCALRLYPATPGWGVQCGRVCLGRGFGCSPPLLASVLGPVCACVRAPLVPRHCWLWCWGVFVFVCLGSGFGCAPPLLAGVLSCVCVRVRAPLVRRHSRLGCAAWVCAFGLGFQLRPATAGWGFWGVCVLVCVLRLYPATPGWDVRCGCVCFGSGFGCAPPLLAGACVYSGARSACTPPLLAELCGVGVCVWARVSAAPRLSWLGCLGVRVCVRAPLVPRHSWLGCAVWVGVLELWFLLRPVTPGWGVGVCVFVCALRLYPATPGSGVQCGRVCLGPGFGCSLPVLAWVLGPVSACVRAPLVPRHCWLWCWGVLVFVYAVRW